MKRITFILLALLAALGLQAKGEDARKLLEQTSKTVKAAGNLQVKFTATHIAGSKQESSVSGTLYLSGRKLHLVSDQALYWFDGKSLWTYLKQNEEVNITTPSAQEQQRINPYLFLNLYKEGYTCTVDGAQDIRGHHCTTVRMAAQKAGSAFPTILVDIDQTTKMPVTVRLKSPKGQWLRVSILDYKTKQKFNDSFFTFKAADHPSVDVVDLR